MICFVCIILHGLNFTLIEIVVDIDFVAYHKYILALFCCKIDISLSVIFLQECASSTLMWIFVHLLVTC